MVVGRWHGAGGCGDRVVGAKWTDRISENGGSNGKAAGRSPGGRRRPQWDTMVLAAELIDDREAGSLERIRTGLGIRQRQQTRQSRTPSWPSPQQNSCVCAPPSPRNPRFKRGKNRANIHSLEEVDKPNREAAPLCGRFFSPAAPRSTTAREGTRPATPTRRGGGEARRSTHTRARQPAATSLVEESAGEYIRRGEARGGEKIRKHEVEGEKTRHARSWRSVLIPQGRVQLPHDVPASHKNDVPASHDSCPYHGAGWRG